MIESGGGDGGTVTLRGTVVKTLYRAGDDGFTVMRVAVRGGMTAVVGEGLALHDGEEAIFTGQWVDNPKFGRQFRVSSFTPITPDSITGIRRFLTSGLIKGVGEVTADRLLERFGDRVLEVLESDQAAVARIKGVGRKRARRISESYAKHRETRDLMVFLQSYGIGPGMAMRVHQRYGASALAKVRENPYRLALEVRGIGFLTADRLALALGIDPLSMERAEAGILHQLEEAYVGGHLYLPADELRESTEKLLKTTVDAVQGALRRLEARALVLEEEGAIYRSPYHELECVVADSLRKLLSRGAPDRAGDLDRQLKAAGNRLGFQLSAEQAQAVLRALTQRITVITGGPGTGKTTLVRAITEAARKLRLKTELASPTGRAAKRLAEATGEPARTIHRLLEFEPESGAFARTASRPLGCDLLIVDEGSMVDMALMAALLGALPERAGLILVGDADQLPSVGAGTVFRDLVASERIPVERLTHIFRQARGSLIVENAHRILRGEDPEVPAGREPEPGQDFFIVWEEDPDRIVRMIKLLVSERIPERFGFDPLRDVQVLSPMHRGLAGVANLNRELQELLNPVGPALKHGDRVLRAGDKVMQTRNDYDKDVFNGDIGRIEEVDLEDRGLLLEVDDRMIEYEAEELSDLQLAYASSIHKSQGSEYPAVIVALAREHHIMCQRNLLYTALTRGKALTVLVGSRSAIRRAVRNDQVQQRYSRLRERLRGEL